MDELIINDGIGGQFKSLAQDAKLFDMGAITKSHIKFQVPFISTHAKFFDSIFDYQRNSRPIFFHYCLLTHCAFLDNIGGQINLNCVDFEKCLFNNIGTGFSFGNFVEGCSFCECTFSIAVFDVDTFSRNKFKDCIFVDCTFPESSFFNLFEGNCKFIRCSFPKDCLKACAIDKNGVEMYECLFGDNDTAQNIEDVIKEGEPDLDFAKLRDPMQYIREK